mmetsp:Transcript_78236/g.242573  ORF Transcript_78236/g.242573 Transcript_78236/m.242573 type:complete len:205 (-) Transcript_78236:43-657(-)
MKPLRLPVAKSGGEEPCPGLIVLQNPDGSLGIGLPPGTALPQPPSSPRGSRDAARDVGQLPRTERMLSFHGRCFFALLVSELIIEFIFNVLLLSVAKHSVEAVSLLYANIPNATLWSIFWGLFACEISYIKVYYGLGFVALAKGQPRVYHWFTNISILGIVVQVLFAYMNKFNLLIFLMRLSSYVYAKFMRIQLERASLLASAF